MLEDCHSATNVRETNNNISVKSSRSSQSLVQKFREVRCCQNDNSAVLFEAVQFGKQLVESLFNVGCITRISLASYGIQFIDENNSRGFSFGSREELTNSLGSDTNVDLIEFGSRHEEEWHDSFTGNSSCEKSLSGTRWAYQQDTLWKFATKS